MRTRAASVVAAAVIVVGAGLGCGGGAANDAKQPGGAGVTAGSPEEQCLAVAGATHERKAKEPDAVKVSHILVEFRDARNAKPGITRSRGEACLRALAAQKKLTQGGDFAQLVTEFSDSPGASGDGSMGEVHRADLDPKFADAAFQLERGQMSDVVETPSGFHVIVRTE